MIRQRRDAANGGLPASVGDLVAVAAAAEARSRSAGA